MFKRLRLGVVGVLISVLLLTQAGPLVHAQQQAGQGLEISPPLIELKADPGDTLTTEIRIRNITKQTLIAESEVNDFTSNNQNGLPQLLLEEGQESPYSIKTWVGDIADEPLKPGKQASMKVTIRVPKDASPGAHFGVIRFTGVPPELRDTGVSLSASLGSLVFISVSGDTTEEALIKDITTSQNDKTRSFFESGPVTVNGTIENTGNVYLKPAGTVRVTDMFGKETGNFTLNNQGGIVLPGSSRTFSQALEKKNLFGKYNVQVDVVYGTDNTIVSGSHTFWVIPYKVVFGVILGLVAVFFLIRQYNRFIVKKSRRRK